MSDSMLNVVLENRTATFLQPYDYDKIIPYFMFRVPGWEFMKAKYPSWDGYIRLLKQNKVGAGLFLARRDALVQKEGIALAVHDNRKRPELKNSGITSDRPYQMECLQKMLDAKTGGLILNATGSGKTFIAGMYFSRLVGNAVFVVDELQLLKQAQLEISTVMGEPVGQVGKMVFDPKRITVATIQTMHLHKNDPKFLPWAKSLKTIILDEVHLSLSRRNFETVAAIKPLVVFGLTATLELRKSHVALKAYNICGPVLFEYGLDRGVKEGYLSPGMVVFMDFINTFEKQKGSWRFNRGSSAQEYTSAIVDNAKRQQFVCQIVREAIKRGKHVVVLVERIKHIQALHKDLADIDHRIACGMVRVEERLNAGKAFEAGNVKLILATKVFKKGINLKKIDVVIDAAAGRSKNDAIQKYGRGVRLCEGKKGLLYFDIADKTPAHHVKKHRWENAANDRRSALKSRGIVSGRAPANMSISAVFDRAEKELEKIIAA